MPAMAFSLFNVHPGNHTEYSVPAFFKKKKFPGQRVIITHNPKMSIKIG